MHCVVALRDSHRLSAPAVLLMCALCAAAGAETAGTQTPQLLTNLFQLRQQADQGIQILHPFRVVAEVITADTARGVLALRDSSSAEFIRIGFTNRGVVPGATVLLEGRGCAVKREGFGLAVAPGMVVDNDGIHAVAVGSGRVVLNTGMIPIRLGWFNRFGDLVLGVEYEGPNLPRQPIPNSVLSRAVVDRVARHTNYLTGLNYRCYEGDWEFLPDFGELQPTKSGVAANFDLKVGPQKDNVGLEFTGFIKISDDGVYTFHVNSDDGSRLFIGAAAVDVRVVSGGSAPVAERTVPERILESTNRPWVTFEGTVDSAGIWSSEGELWMRVGDDEIQVGVFDGSGEVSSIPRHGRVGVTGLYEVILTEDGLHLPGRLLVLNWQAVQPGESGEASGKSAEGKAKARLPVEAGVSKANGLPTLSTAAEVKALSPNLAQQRLPVSIRGVVTVAKRPFAVMQDSTKGIYVDLSYVQAGESIRRGEFCQVDGVTGAGLFAPIIIGQRVIRLGVGQLPKPVRATRAQLINGGLDSEYVEIDGVVTAVQNRRLTLLTQGGKIAVELQDFRPEVLPEYEDALIRIRGCCQANFNLETRKLEVGSITVGGALVEVLERAPSNLFDAPKRSIGELLFYDPDASPFRRLKISGQVLYSRAGEYFLTDGTNGVHVTTRKPDGFGIGDLVDAVGFLEVGGPAAELTEAVMRKTGHAPLPPPMKLPSGDLLQARHAGTLVQLDATLINYWRDASEQIMELQSGFLAFKARIRAAGPAISLPPFGSRLELTGVYAPKGKGPGGTVSGFDLLLLSRDEIRVLAMPSWWTLKKVLVLAGILAAILCGVLIWNKELHRKVEERGRQLETEIRHRQRAELQQAAEAERSRIARDLHDELGTGLTEVSLLASAGLGQFLDGEKIRERFHGIAEKARALVSGLDVIVWAIDPKRNSLQSFADYLADYANELFSHSAIACRLRLRIECGTITLTEAARHSLFLAVKETLNNVIRHASAREVELRISQVNNHLHIVITDNGCGFDLNTIRRGNGLANLQERLQAMQGECHVESQPGGGTTVKFIVPLLPADQYGPRT